MEDNIEKENWVIGLIYIINTVIGSSYFGFPWIFSKAGYIYSTIIQVIATLLSVILSYLTIQTWSRLTIISNLINKGHTINVVLFEDIFSNSQKNYIEKNKKIDSESEDESKPLTFNTNNNFYQMTKLTLGEFIANIFLIVVTFSRISLLATYPSIFASSMASNIPLFGFDTCNVYDYSGFLNECKYKYWTYTAIFLVIMLPTCFFTLRQQKWMQIALFIFRFLFAAVIIVTCVVAIATKTELEGNGENEADPKTFDFIYTGKVISMILFGNLYQSVLTTITEFVDHKSKSLFFVNNLASSIILVLCVFTGLITVFAIEDVEKLISLNWSDYSAGYDLDEKPWWCYFISYTVIMMPVVIILSVFPIYSANLSDIIISYSHQYDDLFKKDYVIYI